MHCTGWRRAGPPKPTTQGSIPWRCATTRWRRAHMPPSRGWDTTLRTSLARVRVLPVARHARHARHAATSGEDERLISASRRARLPPLRLLGVPICTSSPGWCPDRVIVIRPRRRGAPGARRNDDGLLAVARGVATQPLVMHRRRGGSESCGRSTRGRTWMVTGLVGSNPITPTAPANAGLTQASSNGRTLSVSRSLARHRAAGRWFLIWDQVTLVRLQPPVRIVTLAGVAQRQSRTSSRVPRPSRGGPLLDGY